jgi:lipoprotein signal peptidase
MKPKRSMRFPFSHTLTALLIGGAVFVIDRYAKWLAHSSEQASVYLIKPWLGFEYFANPGAAFGFPFPPLLAFVVTPFLVLLFFVWVQKNMIRPWSTYALTFFFVGAVSNYIDRVVYEITIDYLRIATSIINLADIAVLVGIGFVFFAPKKKEV